MISRAAGKKPPAITCETLLEAPAMSGKSASTTRTASGRRVSLSQAAVTRPIVPSLPVTTPVRS